MIPQSFIDAWRKTAPWGSDMQVEQDLAVSRAVAELFSDRFLTDVSALLRNGLAYDPSIAFEQVSKKLFLLIPD